MAKATIVQLADDVTDQLNKKQGGWSKQFTAERKYRPNTALDQRDKFSVQTAIAAWRVSPDNRTDWAHEFDIHIAVQYRAAETAQLQSPEQFDDCLKLAEEISNYWEITRPTIANCPLTGIGFFPEDSPYIPQHIDQLDQFTSVIRLTFWKLRDPTA